MTWNYRIIKVAVEYYCIHEVYYNKAGKIIDWTKDPKDPWGDTVKDLRVGLELMLKAFDYPVLEVATKKGKERLVEVKKEAKNGSI